MQFPFLVVRLLQIAWASSLTFASIAALLADAIRIERGCKSGALSYPGVLLSNTNSKESRQIQDRVLAEKTAAYLHQPRLYDLRDWQSRRISARFSKIPGSASGFR